ncbi:MAG TPA: hypothetical protein VG944_02810 [Fimbriimonas sp.]|nr:hypothetical protein [Fimbriimonas sp.]
MVIRNWRAWLILAVFSAALAGCGSGYVETSDMAHASGKKRTLGSKARAAALAADSSSQ